MALQCGIVGLLNYGAGQFLIISYHKLIGTGISFCSARE